MVVLVATHCDKEKKPLKVGENFDSGCLFLSKPNGGVSRRAHTHSNKPLALEKVPDKTNLEV